MIDLFLIFRASQPSGRTSTRRQNSRQTGRTRTEKTEQVARQAIQGRRRQNK